LGISGGGTFNVPQVKAPLVLIQILSMYCPYCQREAPNVNELYKRIEQDENFRGKIKVIGIGAGNSAYEVGLYRKKFNVPFPVIPDPDFVAYERIGGEVRTPYFIAVRNQTAGADVFYSAVGGLGDPAKFLDQIARSGGLK
jgi:thiol-disulfide isomerase/thioredoxin